MSDKTVAERLREIANSGRRCEMIAEASGKECEDFTVCAECARAALTTIADQIEAEQAERPHEVDVDVDVDALLKLADDLEETNRIAGRVHLNPIEAADRIREILKGAKPQLPDGIEWPRFEDGELVKFGDKFEHDGITDTVEQFTFREAGFWVYGNGDPAWELYSWGEPVKRPEPEVLDVDGVPIKVGDTVWDGKGNSHEVISIESRDEDEQIVWCGEYLGSIKFCYVANELTHRKPDTFESVVAEMLADFDNNDSIEVDGYFDRLRKLLGGE